jgi:hypothetical protein
MWGFTNQIFTYIDLPQKAKALAENQQSISLGEVLQSHWLPLLFDHT